MSKKKIISLAVGVIIVAGIAIWAFGGQAKKRKVVYETATVDRANISNSVTATGTIEPMTEVEVGTQVSGIIDRLYADYNSVVTKGQLIAEMDKVTLQSELASQKATYDGAKAEYEYQQKNYERNKGLHEKQLISDTDYEQSLYNYQKAKSAFDSSKASLAKAERNLSFFHVAADDNAVDRRGDGCIGQIALCFGQRGFTAVEGALCFLVVIKTLLVICPMQPSPLLSTALSSAATWKKDRQ